MTVESSSPAEILRNCLEAVRGKREDITFRLNEYQGHIEDWKASLTRLDEREKELLAAIKQLEDGEHYAREAVKEFGSQVQTMRGISS